MGSLILSISLWVGALSGIENPNIRAALQRLVDGNRRYVESKFEHPNRSAETRTATAAGQNPFATILGCSDSRASPEIIFDQGIGDLFVVRVAGNVASDIETDSIDYSVIYLGSQLILVLGHESCGAVTAVLNHTTKDIEQVAKLIEPAITSTDTVEAAVKANVRAVVRQLKNTRVISRLINEGKVDVVGGYYQLTTGKVELLDLPK